MLKQVQHSVQGNYGFKRNLFIGRQAQPSDE